MNPVERCETDTEIEARILVGIQTNISKIVKDRLNELCMTPHQFKTETGFSMILVNKIIAGRAELTIAHIAVMEWVLHTKLINRWSMDK